MSAFLQKIWLLFLDFLFPVFCLGCKKEGRWLCQNCRQNIRLQEKQVCPFCYKESESGVVCAHCKEVQKCALDGVLVAARFEEKSLLQRCIHNFKYEGLKDMGNELGILLANLLTSNNFSHDVLCPVPLHFRRLHWRGFNQSEVLTETLHGKLNIPIHHLLLRASFHVPQMELSREERKKNVIDAFAINTNAFKNFPQDRNVILVDDVCTTTSTLEACASTLKQNGVKNVFAIVLARAY